MKKRKRQIFLAHNIVGWKGGIRVSTMTTIHLLQEHSFEFVSHDGDHRAVLSDSDA